MEGEGADEGEAVDVAEMDFSAEEKEGAEEEEEEDGAGEVGVVHYVRGDRGEGREYREGLWGFGGGRSAKLLEAGWIGWEFCFFRRVVCLVSAKATFARTLPLMCPKFTPSSSSSAGSPSYPSVPNAANHPVRNPPCSPIRPLTPGPKLGWPPKLEAGYTGAACPYWAPYWAWA